jgi:hypothetical protein
MKLLTSQKNILFELIQKTEFSPLNFEFKDIPSEKYMGQPATELRLKKTDYFFRFETGPRSISDHHAVFAPGLNTFTEELYSNDWDVQVKIVKDWLRNLSREISSPNKWERLQNEIKHINITNDIDSNEEKFTVTEFEELEQRINTLKSEIIKIELTESQINTINSKLDHLTTLAKVMNRFDWKSLFIGTIISIIIQLEVNPNNAKLLWSYIRSIFSNYFLQ